MDGARIDRITERWEDRDGDHGLRDMCDEGARRAAKDPNITLRFEVWNEAERDFVSAYMSRRHEGVRFFCTWLVFKDSAPSTTTPYDQKR